MSELKLTLHKISDDYYQIKDTTDWVIIQMTNFDDIGWTVEIDEFHCICKYPKNISFDDALKKGIAEMRRQLDIKIQRIKKLLIELTLSIEKELPDEEEN